MAQDKRKVVGQNDNETESLRFDYELHALRQKYVRALVQTEGGVVISKPTKRCVTCRAVHVEARMKTDYYPKSAILHL